MRGGVCRFMAQWAFVFFVLSARMKRHVGRRHHVTFLDLHHDSAFTHKMSILLVLLPPLVDVIVWDARMPFPPFILPPGAASLRNAWQAFLFHDCLPALGAQLFLFVPVELNVNLSGTSEAETGVQNGATSKVPAIRNNDNPD